MLLQIKSTFLAFVGVIIITLMHSFGIFPGPVIVPGAVKDKRILLPIYLSRNRTKLEQYYRRYQNYPILKNDRFNFWDFQTSQFLWMLEFKGIKNGPSSPEGEIFKKNHGWVIWDPQKKVMKHPEEKEFLFLFANPISGKFDWLAEDASGTFYSPNMPDSVLIASPPIRVVNIRCPQTASDPPFFEDFTKW